jgi:cytochrome oxidase assembly protein ShyY1
MLLAPRFWPGHLLMVLALAVATGLGLWQLHVWQAERSAQASDVSSRAPVALSGVLGPDAVLTNGDVGRQVRFTGTWMGADTMYVADRRSGDRTGYWVVTPVRVGDSAVPVVRGWSARPHATASTGQARVTGWLQPSEGSGAVDDNPRDDVLPELRIASMVEHVDVDLYSAYVVARDPGPGLRAVGAPSMPAVSATTGLRNLLYALQWWVFGGFAVYIWVRWCGDSLELSREQELATG